MTWSADPLRFRGSACLFADPASAQYPLPHLALYLYDYVRPLRLLSLRQSKPAIKDRIVKEEGANESKSYEKKSQGLFFLKK